ncbi:MAG: hypothetical protein C0483_00985 [Pirellula sp.]|nr:hypothetical protein [Pirellula sp.]
MFPTVASRRLTAQRIVWLVVSCAILVASQPLVAAQTTAPADQAQQVGRLIYEANLLRGTGKLSEAAEAGGRALAAFREAVPTTNDNSIILIAWLAEIQEHAEQWPKAEALRDEIWQWTKQRHGAEHWRTADARVALEYTHKLQSFTPAERVDLQRARLLTFLTRETLTEAIAKAQQVCDIRKRILGDQHPYYATSVNDLALQWYYFGDYARAEPLYTQSRDVYHAALGDRHPNFAQSQYNLGLLYERMGDYARAEGLYRSACEIRKQVLGETHLQYARSLLCLATLYVSIGDFARAEPLYVQILEIRKTALDDWSLDYATSLHFLGLLYLRKGDYAQAEPLLAGACDIRKQALGEADPDYASSLHGLGALSYSTGDFAKAERLLTQTCDILKKVLGEHHPDYASSLHSLAAVYTATGNRAQAESLYRQALRISRRSLESASVVQSERQQLAMGQSLRYQLDNYVSLAVSSAADVSNVFSEVLAWKGATLVRQRGMRLAAEDPAVAELFGKLQRTAGQLASLSRVRPETEAQPIGWREKLGDLAAEKERLEAELSARSADFRKATSDVTLEDLVSALPKDAALVDFLEFMRTTPPQKPGLSPTYERQWIAFVVRHTERPTDRVRMFALGPAAPVNTAIRVWRTAFGMDPSGIEAGRRLRATLWDPLLPALAGAKAILVSTDGALGRLPLGALPGREPGTFLLEEHRLATIPVPQLLPTLVNDAGKRQITRELLLIGDVDYDAGDATDSTNPKKKRPRLPGENRAPTDDRRFDPLANTAGEIAAIKDIYARLFETTPDDPRSIVRGEANESSFREWAPGYRHLHIATHGFFAGAEHSSAVGIRSGGQRGRDFLALREEPIVGENPGLLSGLALAGANRNPSRNSDDGILTAQEIGVLDLSAVDTVVLSACDTGLGETAGGEGLLGVQRAFQVAGARTTVATYWKVDDLMTRLLMERFYCNLWEKELSRLDALREAQLYLLNHPEVIRGADAPEDVKVRTSPRYWAAFSLSGDWR